VGHQSWLLVAVVSASTAPQSCEQRQAGPPAFPQVVVGQTASRTITSHDRQCTGSSAPCRVFQISADKPGILHATVSWTKQGSGLRLEMWNGNDDDGTCCQSGETVLVPVVEGDRAEIHVILAEPRGKDVRQPFELSTSINDVQE
jgi:hypothetical protein